ncbi:short transient receptor potential channel 2 isoform X1 [Phascolarctos cinereus]
MRRQALFPFLLFPFCSLFLLSTYLLLPSLSCVYISCLFLCLVLFLLPSVISSCSHISVSFPTTFFPFLLPILHLLPNFVFLPFPSLVFLLFLLFVSSLTFSSSLLFCSFITSFIPSPSDSSGDFLASAASESWDRLRVTCSQPFNRRQPFGLMFLRVRSLLEPREDPENSQTLDHNQVESSVQAPEASPWLASPAIRRTFFPEPQPGLGQVTELRSRLQQLQPGALGRSARMVLSAACQTLPSTSKSLGCHQGEPSPNHTASSDVAEEPGSQKQNSENESRRTKRQKLQNPRRRPLATPGPRQCRKVRPRRQPPQPQTNGDRDQESGQCPICAGSYSFEVLPFHAATCGESAPTHPASPSSSLSSSSASSSPSRTPPSLHSESSLESTPFPAWVQCPICQCQFPAREVAWHASRCGEPPESPWMGLD